MTNVLSARLKRLELRNDMSNPLAHLTDEELDARLLAVTDQIETRVGMPIAEYAAAICKALDAGKPLPSEWTEDAARNFSATLNRVAAGRSIHGH